MKLTQNTAQAQILIESIFILSFLVALIAFCWAGFDQAQFRLKRAAEFEKLLWDAHLREENIHLNCPFGEPSPLFGKFKDSDLEKFIHQKRFKADAPWVARFSIRETLRKPAPCAGLRNVSRMGY